MKLLLAIDLREDPEGILAEARPWVDKLGGTLDLAYVENFGDATLLVNDPNVRALLEDEVKKLHARDVEVLESLLEQLPEAQRGTFHALQGAPADTLAELGNDYDAVLIATHGRTGLSHFWLGSVAERVVRLCTAPVLVLRKGQAG